MRDIDKTKEQLVKELAILRQRVAEIERRDGQGKRAEGALKESENMFRTLAASANDAIIWIDNEAKVKYWNKAAERLFGYREQDIAGKEMHTIIVPRRYLEAHRIGFNKF